MPIHDWSRVESGIFHDFHQAWTIEIRNALNDGGLPPGFFAMAEQILSGPIPDVVSLQRHMPEQQHSVPPNARGGIALAASPPQARFITSANLDRYATRANQLSVKHPLGHVVAVLEIMSPGNKSSQHALQSFVAKTVQLIRSGINLLVVDLFPLTTRDPQGIHKAIWDEVQDEPFQLPADKPLIVAAYAAREPWTAYIEPIAVGDELPALPIFLEPEMYVPAPLESTYQATWAKCPEPIKNVVLAGGAS